MFTFLKKLLRREKTLDSVLKEYGVDVNDVNNDEIVSFEITVNDSTRKKIVKLAENKELHVEKASSQFMGTEVLSLMSSTLTILQALFALEKLVSSNTMVTVNTQSNGKVKMTVNDAIVYFVKSLIKK